MRCVLVSVLLLAGCAGTTPHRPTSDEPTSSDAGPVALDVTDEDCDPLTLGVFQQGAQLGFHLPVGVLAESADGYVALETAVYDADTDELVAYGKPAFYALVGWSEADRTGWIWQSTFVGDGQGGGDNAAVVCGMPGRPLRVEATVTAVGGGEGTTATVEVTGDFDDRDGICP
jgi:hypothetical protein